MGKPNLKRMAKTPSLLIIAGLIVSFFIFLYKEKYLNCLSIEPVACMKSTEYISPTKQFTFRYPIGYPLAYRAGDELMKQYLYDDKFDEWINFSSEFYNNAGGNRLGSIIVTKDTDFKSLQEYTDKTQEDFDKLSDSLKGVSPQIEFVKISGRDAVRITTSQQPSSFTPSSDQYVLIENGKLYTISFDFNDYYHKKPFQYYENSKKIILSTFTFK